MACTLVRAQVNPVDTARQLDEFTVLSTRFQAFTTGIKTGKTDSLTRVITAQNSLAQLLSYNTPVFIKTYGPGQLSTSSFRGASAEHTAVLWNGINIQSTTHGQLDFALLPVGFMDDINVHYGGNSALYGAGAVGGAILIGNTPVYNKKPSVNYQYGIGSFGMQQHWGGIEYGSNRFYVKAKTFQSSSVNNFGYYNYTLPGKPLQYRKNASQYGTGTIVETGGRINPRHELNLRYWYSYNDRDLPPTIGATVNQSYQLDESHRIGLEWKHVAGAHSRWMGRVARLEERLDYQDQLTYITGRSNSASTIAEVENISDIAKNAQLNVGVNYAHNEASSQNYIRRAKQSRIAAFASVKAVFFKKLTASANIRQELINGNAQPFTAAAGLEYALKKWVAFTAHANKSYYVPTFNDLYWVTGNPSLKPEDGYGEELGVVFRASNEKNGLTAQFNAFNRNITNWIIWQPSGGTWTPQNLKEVWSRGGEFSGRYTLAIHKKLFIGLRSDVSYVLSTNEKSIYANDESQGKQLIYIPRLTHQEWLTVSYKKWYLAYNHTYTGYRFTTSDNQLFLDDYSLGNVFAGWGFNYKKAVFDIRVQYNNVWNISYEVLPAKPMPMSNYLLTLSIRFNT